MYARLLIATDGSDLAKKGVDHGLALAKALGASVTIVTASEPWMPVGVDTTGTGLTEYALADEFEKTNAKFGRAILDEASAAAARLGVPCETVYVPRKFPADAIIETAGATDSDLIVMASHGRRGVQRVLLGSQATQVLTHSTLPVLVVR